ncbi:hypothetical protein FOZ62_026248, partial [Perkinsus olseni]
MNPESTHSLFLPAMSQSGTSAHSEGLEEAGQPIEDDNSTSSRENARDGGLNPDQSQALNDSDVLFLESRVRTLENDVKALSAQLMDSQTELAVIQEARDKYRDLYTRFAERHEELMVRLNTAEREREAAARDRERLQVFLKTCCEENNEDAYSLGVKLARSRETLRAMQGSLGYARSEITRLEQSNRELTEEVKKYRAACELSRTVREVEKETQEENFKEELGRALLAKDLQIDREIRGADRATQEASVLKAHFYSGKSGVPDYDPSLRQALQEMEAIDAEIDKLDPAYATWKNRIKCSRTPNGCVLRLFKENQELNGKEGTALNKGSIEPSLTRASRGCVSQSTEEAIAASTTKIHPSYE